MTVHENKHIVLPKKNLITIGRPNASNNTPNSDTLDSLQHIFSNAYYIHLLKILGTIHNVLLLFSSLWHFPVSTSLLLTATDNIKFCSHTG